MEQLYQQPNITIATEAQAFETPEDIFTLDDMFDDLIALAAEQPDDEIALAGLSEMILNAKESGNIEFAMRSAMILGAMACMDPHFESLASQASGALDGHGKDDGHGHADKEDSSDKSETDKHDSKKCSDCKAGRACRKSK